MSQINYVTKETFGQMKAELQHMKGVERPAASRAIGEAREKGDLKENAEYSRATARMARSQHSRLQLLPIRRPQSDATRWRGCRQRCSVQEDCA